MHEKESSNRDLFNKLLSGTSLDVAEIIHALKDSIELGFVEWGERKETIEKLLTEPCAQDLIQLVTQSEILLKPLEDWVKMERNLNALRKGSVSKYDYYHSEYRCSQLQNFILLLKLY